MTAIWIVSLLLGFWLPEKVDLSPEALRKLSTDVVVAEVQAIYTREVKDGRWQTTHYVTELKIDQVEKGKSLVDRPLVYVRYWNRTWTGRGEPPPDTNGHRGLPEQGQKLRVYLARNAYDGFQTAEHNADGGYNVIGANGFEKLKE